MNILHLQTSQNGIAFLRRHEGDVLRAYRCPAGHWTIGAGLTAASGVVTPRAGMTITAEESGRLLALALQRNYEPAVRRVMPGAHQHEFDGGVSFHFNTGAIGRASWVRAWIERNWGAVADGLRAWRKGGGKVLPGLVRRREEELALIRDGIYRSAPAASTPPGFAKVVLVLSGDEIAAARKALAALGYDVGTDPGRFSEAGIRAFQADHGLTVDGTIGRATLSTLQRVIDSRAKAAAAGTVTTGGAAETGTGLAESAVPGGEALGPVVLAVGLIWLAWLAWQYRDTIAAAVHPHLPRAAAWLRSF